jgi:hypothetical protein
MSLTKLSLAGNNLKIPVQGMSLTKLSLTGNNLKIPVQGEFG